MQPIFITCLLWSTWLILSTRGLVSYFCLGWNCYNASTAKGLPQYPKKYLLHAAFQLLNLCFLERVVSEKFTIPNPIWLVSICLFNNNNNNKISKLTLTWKGSKEPAWNTVCLRTSLWWSMRFKEKTSTISHCHYFQAADSRNRHCGFRDNLSSVLDVHLRVQQYAMTWWRCSQDFSWNSVCLL